MKAIVQDTYGSADVLELDDIDPPEPADDQVLVRVHAAGVTRAVEHLMTGLPYLLRLAGFGLRRPTTRVPGLDLAGVVEAVGSRVTRFAVGDEVFGVGTGAFAEHAVAPETKLAHTPTNLTFAQAAALPTSGVTALQAVRDHGRVQPGHHVLVIGASGGVGTYAVQIARAFCARVTGVCGPTKTDLVRSLGADHVLDHTRDDLAGTGEPYDAILDMAGVTPLSRLRQLLTPEGALVLVGGEAGGRWVGVMDRVLRAALLSPFVGHKVGNFMAKENAEDLAALRDLVESGEVAPAVDRTFPLARTADALHHLAAGHARGTIVVTVDAP